LKMMSSSRRFKRAKSDSRTFSGDLEQDARQ
jgi:hypothetical protein